MSFNRNILISTAAIAAMSAGVWLSSMQSYDNNINREQTLAEARKNFSPIQGVVLSPARKIAVPALTKDNEKTFTLDDLTGEWHLLFFGYTHCPDICPATMGVVAQAKKTAEEAHQIFPEVIFISVDPERDTAEMLGKYVRYFDKDFIGVTGNKDLIKALALQMSVVFMATPVKNNPATSDYIVDHSSALLLLNPEGKLAAFLNPPHDPKTILKDFQTVVNLRN
jgi:protein SCO1/2